MKRTALRPGLAAFGLVALALSPHLADGALNCPTPQPVFSYIDADNDGCYTDGVDSGSVDAELQAPLTMANVPSFTAPANTGLVIPRSLILPAEADPFWSIPNDVWIDGQVSGDSSLRIEAGGTTYVNGRIRMQSKGFSDASDVRLGCDTGCGALVVADETRLATSGLLLVYDAAIGNDVRISVKCEPGGVPSCGGRAWFRRTTSIGDRLKLNSPGGIQFEEGVSLLTVGEGADMRTKAVSTDGGTLGFSLSLELAAGVAFGNDATIRAGGSLTIQGAEDAMASSGPVSLGERARLAGSTVSVRGTSVEIGPRSDLRGKRDVSNPGQLSSIFLRAADGPLALGGDSRVRGGRIYLDAGNGLLDVGGGVSLATAGTNQELELAGTGIELGADSSLEKSTSDLRPVLVAAVSSVAIASSTLRGAGIDVSVSDPAAAISFTASEAAGEEGTTAVFSAPGGGTCDLTGSSFTRLALDTTGCGIVVGP